jgi:hypothetical protein
MSIVSQYLVRKRQKSQAHLGTGGIAIESLITRAS